MQAFGNLVRRFLPWGMTGWFSPLRRAVAGKWGKIWQARLEDRIELTFPGVRVSVRRITADPTPHELHVILPRVEIRKGCGRGPAGWREEIILSSITVVDAPRHPLAGEHPPGPVHPHRHMGMDRKETH